jgi:hypothetical protein
MGLLSPLHNLDQLKHQSAAAAQLDPEVAMLRAWQSQRLARTYADLLEQPRYRPACLFFLEDIYAPRDFSQRDHDIEQMYDFMRRFIPAPMLRPLALTVKLHHLTEALDQHLLEVLIDQLGVTDTLTAALYAEAYRRCDNYAERVKQIDMIVEIGERLDGLVKSPLTAMMLNVAKGPARQAGWVELVDFLEHGYTSFKHMHGGQYFLKTVRQREIDALDRMYANNPDPFGFQGSEVSEISEV